jgi:hypothetical protein
LDFQWLTAPATFAATNTNKELKPKSDLVLKGFGWSIRMVNGGLMAK